MAAALFHLPTSRVIDANGIASGSTLTFYDTGTLTKRAIYTTSALSVEHPNPLTVNAGAAVPDIYVDDTYTYRYIAKNAAGITIDDVDPYTGFSASGLNFLQSGTGAVTRTGEGKLRDDVSVLDFIPVANHAAIAADTSTTDVTSYIAAAFLAHDHVHFPDGTYTITSFSVAAGKRLSTDGFGTRFKQASGTAAATPLIKVTGSNVTIESCQVEGRLNQAGDTTGEFNHGVHIALVAGSTASITNVTIGDIKGTNIRGDVIYIGTNATAYTAGYRVSQISVGHVEGSNVYRNVVAITGGSGIDITSITGTQVGLMHFDIESDAGMGPVIGVRVGYIRGRYVAVVPTLPGDYADGVDLGTLDLDPAYTTTSSPAYAPGSTLQHALEVRNCKALKIGKLKANGFNGHALKQTYNGGELARQVIRIGQAEITDCCKTNVDVSYIEGATGVTRLSIEDLTATITLASVAAVKNCTGPIIGAVSASLAAGTFLIRACDDAVVGPLTTTTTGTGTLIFGCSRATIAGGSFNVATISSSADNTKLRDVRSATSATALSAGSTEAHLAVILDNTTWNATHYPYAIVNNGDVVNNNSLAGSQTSVGLRGYRVRAGGQVTQATSKSTGVTLNKVCGDITMNNAALAATTSVSFTFTNSFITAHDEVSVWIKSGAADPMTYDVQAHGTAAGSRSIGVYNRSAGSLGEALVLGFAIRTATIT